MKLITNNDISRQRFSEPVAFLKGAIQTNRELRFETEQAHPGDDKKNRKKAENWLICSIRSCCNHYNSLLWTKYNKYFVALRWPLATEFCQDIWHGHWRPVLPAHPRAPYFSEAGERQAVQPVIQGTNGPFPSNNLNETTTNRNFFWGLYSRALTELYQRYSVSLGTQCPVCWMQIVI